MSKFITIGILFTLAAGCAPTGGGSGGELEAHTGWRGLLSAGPASADGAIRCGVPDRQFFTCDEGASVKRGDFWMGCVEPGQADIGGNGSKAKGDFVLLDRDDRVVNIGRTTAEAITTVYCTKDSEPVERAWLGQVAEQRPGFPKIEEACWNPATGEAADCAAMGRD